MIVLASEPEFLDLLVVFVKFKESPFVCLAVDNLLLVVAVVVGRFKPLDWPIADLVMSLLLAGVVVLLLSSSFLAPLAVIGVFSAPLAVIGV